MGSGTLQGQQSSHAAVFRLVLPPELVLPLHSCVDSCTQTLHYRLPGDCFLNELINVINFVLAKEVRSPIPATGRNSHSNSEHNWPWTLFLFHSSNIACFQGPLLKPMLLEQYPSLLSRSGFPLFGSQLFWAEMSSIRSLRKSSIYCIVAFPWTAFLWIKIQLVIWKLLFWQLLVSLPL